MVNFLRSPNCREAREIGLLDGCGGHHVARVGAMSAVADAPWVPHAAVEGRGCQDGADPAIQSSMACLRVQAWASWPQSPGQVMKTFAPSMSKRITVLYDGSRKP